MARSENAACVCGHHGPPDSSRPYRDPKPGHRPDWMDSGPVCPSAPRKRKQERDRALRAREIPKRMSIKVATGHAQSPTGHASSVRSAGRRKESRQRPGHVSGTEQRIPLQENTRGAGGAGRRDTHLRGHEV
uniref:Uncharacterized protein n=1 Tax=Rousettus aegyptiacus TaxID=9407 RepID=A0A7J8E8C4_ROUAE|nr:hypothetical protein HJG63_008111 [Rousettus aegyptiacus]